MDNKVPRVSTFTPPDAATGVATGSNLVLIFNEEVRRGTGVISIYSGSANGTLVASYNVAISSNITLSGNTLTINPADDLLHGTHYFVALDPGSVKDLSGNNYSGSTDYDFTTASAKPMVAGSLESWEYLASWRDLIDALGTDTAKAALHYNTYAKAENRFIGFDALDYLASNNDLMNAFGTNVQKAAEHYILFGRNESRSFAFDAAAYLAANIDLFNVMGTDYEAATKHYIEFGRFEIEQGLRAPLPSLVDTTSPTIFSFNPFDASMGVAVDSDIVLTFSEAIEKGSGVIEIHTGSATGPLVAGYNAATSQNLVISGKTLTIDPTSELLNNTHYFVTLASGSITDLAGNGYAGTTAYDFTTALPSVADTTAPTVFSYSPSDAAIGVAVGSNIVLTFSEAIKKGSGMIVINSGSATGTTVAVFDVVTSGNLSVSGSTLTINPSTDLATGTEYFVSLAAGSIKDLAGNSYAAQTGSYHFKTAGTFVMTAGYLESWEYLASYPDLMNAFGTDVAAAASHYNNFGAAEHRSISFDAWDYLASNNDLMNAFGTDVQKAAAHYITNGRNESRSFAFDADSYVAANEDLLLFFGTDYDGATMHYIDVGRFEMAQGWRPSFSTVFLTPPELIGYAPADDASGVPVSSDIVLTFSKAIQKGSGTIVIHIDSATGTAIATYDVATSENLAISGKILTINPAADLGNGTHYFVTLDAGSIKDLAGNSYEGTSTYDFTTADTIAPTVFSYTPLDDSTGVAIESDIVLTFSEAIQKGSGTIVIHSGSATGTSIATYDVATSGNLEVSGNTLTINPTADFANSTHYFVTLGAGTIKDLAGNSYEGTTTYDFTTEADLTAPTVFSYSPFDDSTGVAVESDIILTFSEAIQKGSGTIVIHSGSATGTPIAIYDAATSGNLAILLNTLTINPTADLASSTHYFVTFDAGTIKDLAGNSYEGTTTYDFITAADTTPPWVIGFSPHDAAVDVSVSSNIVLTFSETIQRGSGTIEIHRDSPTGSVVESYDAATSGNLSLSGNILTINPDADLANGTHYYLTISEGSVTDLVGNNYYGTSNYDFTTVAVASSAFNISLDYSGDEAYRTYFQQAVTRWEEIITGDLPAYGGIDDISISASVSYIDGSSGILGQAGPTEFRTDSNQLPYNGFMKFDSADVEWMADNGILTTVIMHEIAHVLGFGSDYLWDYRGFYAHHSGQYTGANALNEYRSMSGNAFASYVPVETGGGAGTADAHWSESVFGSELMTGWSSNSLPMPLSRLTIGAMEDLGYTVNYSAADVFSLSSPLKVEMAGFVDTSDGTISMLFLV